MLGTRLVSGLAMAGLVLAILFLDEWLFPWYPLWLAFTTAVAGLAALELVGLLGRTSARPSGNTVFGGVLAVVAAGWVPNVLNYLQQPGYSGSHVPPDALAAVHALAWPLMTFAAVVMATFVAQSVQFRNPGGTMAAVSATVFAVAYIGLLSSFLIGMRWFDGPYHGLPALVFLLVTAKGADTGAYTFGRLAGRHKLWPRLSPNKTIEGAFGGLVFGVGGALLVAFLARHVLGIATLDNPTAAAYGLIVGAAAQLGDLMESMIKRDCERKDASTAVPGFGGVLDVVDSLLFAGPVAFAFWQAVGA